MPDLTAEDRATRFATDWLRSDEPDRISCSRPLFISAIAAVILLAEQAAERRGEERAIAKSARLAFDMQAKDGRSDIGNAIQAIRSRLSP